MSDFLWPSCREVQKDHPVKWDLLDLVCRSKAGGLGAGRVIIRHTALVGEWWWRFPREHHSLW